MSLDKNLSREALQGQARGYRDQLTALSEAGHKNIANVIGQELDLVERLLPNTQEQNLQELRIKLEAIGVQMDGAIAQANIPTAEDDVRESELPIPLLVAAQVQRLEDLKEDLADILGMEEIVFGDSTGEIDYRPGSEDVDRLVNLIIGGLGSAEDVLVNMLQFGYVELNVVQLGDTAATLEGAKKRMIKLRRFLQELEETN